MADAVTAADIPWLAPAPWPDARPVVAAARRYLPLVTDDDAAALIEHLVLALADLKAERDVLREALGASLAVARRVEAERLALEARYHDALNRLRGKAA